MPELKELLGQPIWLTSVSEAPFVVSGTAIHQLGVEAIMYPAVNDEIVTWVSRSGYNSVKTLWLF